MPIYEYKCRKCGKQFEASQRITEKALSQCPTCRGKVDRLISASAIQFKGTGWYVTDYARKGSGDREKSEGKKDDGGKADDKKPADAAVSPAEGGKKKAPASKSSSSSSDD